MNGPMIDGTTEKIFCNQEANHLSDVYHLLYTHFNYLNSKVVWEVTET